MGTFGIKPNGPITSKINTALLVLVSMCCIAIFIFPFARVLTVSDESMNPAWKSWYLFQDESFLLFYLPFVLLWVVWLFIKKSIKEKIFPLLLFAAGLSSFAVSFTSVTLPAQDYEPAAGVLISLLIFPLMIVQLVLQSRLNKKTNQSA